MSTYVGDLITEVRRDTDNTDVSVDSSGNLQAGISTEDFLRYFNFALMRLQGLIIQRNTSLFRRSQDISLVAGQAQYTIDDNVFLKESIVDVKYSPDGQENNYQELKEMGESYRSYSPSYGIVGYTRRQGSIFLTAPPSASTGKLRVVYYRAVDRLDLRRGAIDAITFSGGSVSANTVSLDIATVSDESKARLGSIGDKYFGIVDKDGIVQAYSLPYTVYNTGTGTFTHSAKAAETGMTPAIGQYLTLGKYSTTHLQELDSLQVERYMQLYAAIKIFRRDSSSDEMGVAKEFAAVEQEILETFQILGGDEGEIQIADPWMFDFDVV